MNTSRTILSVFDCGFGRLVRLLLLCALFMLVYTKASAQVDNGPRSHILKFGFGADLGWGTASATGDASTTVVGEFNFNSNFGFVLYERYVIGSRGDYRFLTQFSSVDPKVGNRRGFAFSAPSPLIGIFVKDFFISVAYVFTGEFDLANTTVSGSAVKYVSPSGYRLDFEWELPYLLKPTLYYESVTYNGLVSGQSNISNPGPLALNTYGIGVIWTY